MFVLLLAKGFRLSLAGEADVAGRKAVGILVSHDKHSPVTLYFDKETHLLAKYGRKFKVARLGQRDQRKSASSPTITWCRTPNSPSRPRHSGTASRPTNPASSE